MRGDVTDAGQTNERRQKLKIELLIQWKLEAESRKYNAPTGGFQNPYNHNPYCVRIFIGSVGILIGS